MVENARIVELLVQGHPRQHLIVRRVQVQHALHQRVQAVGGRGELIEHRHVDDGIVAVAEATAAQSQAEMGKGSRTENERQKLVVEDVLQLGDDDALCLLVEGGVAPVGIQLGELSGDAVVLAHPGVVQHRQVDHLVDAIVAAGETAHLRRTAAASFGQLAVGVIGRLHGQELLRVDGGHLEAAAGEGAQLASLGVVCAVDVGAVDVPKKAHF